MDWSKLKVTELKAELKRRGLPQNGLKADLVLRLEEAEAKQPQAEVEEAPEPEPQPPEDIVPTANGDAVATTSETPDVPQNKEVTAQDDVEDVEMAVANPDAVPQAQPPQDLATEETKEQVPESKPAAISETKAELVDAPAPSMEIDATGTATTDIPPDIRPAVNAPESTAQPLQDLQKRKRSASASPVPDEEARKRQKADTENEQLTEPLNTKDKSNPALTSGASALDQDVDMEDQPSAERTTVDPPESAAPALEQPATSNVDRDILETRRFPILSADNTIPDPAHEMEIERDIQPAIHPATSALYIKNFMRPLRAPDVQDHLAKLAASPGTEPSLDEVVEFFLDQIRTHAFVVFKSISAASRVRTALHDCVWPDEVNRKPLWVDFVSPDKVGEWISTEEAQGGGRGSAAKRWVVNYGEDDDGSIIARLETEDKPNRVPTGPGMRGPPPPSNARPQPMVSSNSANNIPLGPRSQRGQDIPPIRGHGRGSAGHPGGKFNTTATRPFVTYQTVSEDLARQRLEDMRSYYTKDTRRDLGKEINRYTFEEGFRFVDRGTEVFEGIRPPHREKERGRQGHGRSYQRDRPRFGGGRRGGPPPFRPKSDRYLPSFSDRGDRPRFDGGRRRFDDDRGRRGDKRRDDYQNDEGRLRFDDRDNRDTRY